jgi:S-DNA-T family DNA segregation ATPase FtsK/SpoIIIE
VDRCDACAFVYDDVAPSDVPGALRRLADEYHARLVTTPGGPPDVEHDLRLRAHPLSGVWSALEYACHVRDLLEVQRERVQLTLDEDRPAYAPMGREERVVDDRYNEQEPEAVAAELQRAADNLARDLDALDEDGWARTGIYNWPTKQERTLAWLGRHTVHELEHHLRDIDDVLAAGAQ